MAEVWKDNLLSMRNLQLSLITAVIKIYTFSFDPRSDLTIYEAGNSFIILNLASYLDFLFYVYISF